MSSDHSRAPFIAPAPVRSLVDVITANGEAYAAELDAVVWEMAADMLVAAEDDQIEKLRRAWTTAYDAVIMAMQEYHASAVLHVDTVLRGDRVPDMDMLLDRATAARAAYVELVPNPPD